MADGAKRVFSVKKKKLSSIQLNQFLGVHIKEGTGTGLLGIEFSFE